MPPTATSFSASRRPRPDQTGRTSSTRCACRSMGCRDALPLDCAGAGRACSRRTRVLPQVPTLADSPPPAAWLPIASDDVWAPELHATPWAGPPKGQGTWAARAPPATAEGTSHERSRNAPASDPPTCTLASGEYRTFRGERHPCVRPACPVWRWVALGAVPCAPSIAASAGASALRRTPRMGDGPPVDSAGVATLRRPESRGVAPMARCATTRLCEAVAPPKPKPDAFA